MFYWLSSKNFLVRSLTKEVLPTKSYQRSPTNEVLQMKSYQVLQVADRTGEVLQKLVLVSAIAFDGSSRPSDSSSRSDRFYKF